MVRTHSPVIATVLLHFASLLTSECVGTRLEDLGVVRRSTAYFVSTRLKGAARERVYLVVLDHFASRSKNKLLTGSVHGAYCSCGADRLGRSHDVYRFNTTPIFTRNRVILNSLWACFIQIFADPTHLVSVTLTIDEAIVSSLNLL